MKAVVYWTVRGIVVVATEVIAAIAALTQAERAVVIAHGLARLLAVDSVLETTRPLLALEVAVEYLVRRGYEVGIVAPELVCHTDCGHTLTWKEWRALVPIDCHLEEDLVVPTRSCPGCLSTISGNALVGLPAGQGTDVPGRPEAAVPPEASLSGKGT